MRQRGDKMAQKIRMKKREHWTPLGIFGLLCTILVTVIAVFPFIYMFLMSFTESRTLKLHLADVDFTNMENFIYIFQNSGFLQAFFNSVVVVVASCVLNVIVSCMAAYGFEKKLFPGRKFIFQIYMISLMIPGQVTMIPLFVIMKNLGLLNTRTALVITMIGAFSVFLVKQFMNGVPDELIESAQVDGCPEYRIFIQIVMPLLKPVVVTLVVFTFISAWNDFLWPLIAATETEHYTLIVALSVLKTQYSVNYGLIMAGSLITFIFPFILYIFLQKQFVQGIALGGVKG